MKITNKEISLLEEYLDSVLSNRSLSYSITPNQESEECEVSIWENYDKNKSQTININMKVEEGDQVLINIYEDIWEDTNWYDNTVEHF